jgi:hypothetical protein
MWSSIWLAVRSVIWAIVFPGMVAGYIPWRFFGVGGATFDRTSLWHVFGLACITAGASMLAWCIFEFARHGRGTLSVFDPTSRLVVHGLYRYSVKLWLPVRSRWRSTGPYFSPPPTCS